MKRILCLSALALAAVGCQSPKVMTEQAIIGGRIAKATYTRTGAVGSGKDQKAVFDFGMIICDVNDQGEETNCGDTTLMQAVTYFPIPK